MLNLKQKEEQFYTFFNEFGKIVNEATSILKSFVEDLSNSEVKFREIEEIEHRGDKELHDIMQALNKTYMTPFDREDIYAIAKGLDDIVDYVEETSSKFILFNVNQANDHAKRMASKIALCGSETVNLMKEMKNLKANKKLNESIIEINRLENEGDNDFRVAVKELFTEEYPVEDVIKWREIYEYLELTLNACEDLADIVEGIVMKHA
jgi:uncharacterized protein